MSRCNAAASRCDAVTPLYRTSSADALVPTAKGCAHGATMGSNRATLQQSVPIEWASLSCVASAAQRHSSFSRARTWLHTVWHGVWHYVWHCVPNQCVTVRLLTVGRGTTKAAMLIRRRSPEFLQHSNRFRATRRPVIVSGAFGYYGHNS